MLGQLLQIAYFACLGELQVRYLCLPTHNDDVSGAQVPVHESCLVEYQKAYVLVLAAALHHNDQLRTIHHLYQIAKCLRE